MKIFINCPLRVVSLICYIAFMNAQKSTAQNLLDMSEWVIGEGSTGGFVANGPTKSNIREWGAAPNGERAIIWTAIPSGAAQADGGWNKGVDIDHRKKYRYTVWLKKHNSHDGHSYLGCSNVAGLDNIPDNNPYFWYGRLPELGKWYLLVGYVHGSSDESKNHEGAIYDGETGRRIQSITDFKFLPDAKSTLHRSYLYYDPNVNDRQYFYGPRLEVIDGTEVPLATLLESGSNANRNPMDMDGNLSVSEENAVYVRRGDDFHKLAYRREINSKLVDGPVVFGWSGGALGTSTEKGESVALQWIQNGNVGIGTSEPRDRLSVNGNIRAHELKVEANNWPDYVFEKNYELRSIADLEQYIDQHGHLPEIPKAEDIEADGLSLGEMNKLLLKKVEELTLYLIRQSKELDQFKNSHLK